MIRLENLVAAALESATVAHANSCPANACQCEACKPDTPALCTCHQGKARFAASLYQTAKDGNRHLWMPHDAEMFREVVGATADGQVWVVARRSPRILAKYGEDVVCLSPAKYAAAERECLRRRCIALGVMPFGELA